MREPDRVGGSAWLRRVLERRVTPRGAVPFPEDEVDRRAAVVLVTRPRRGRSLDALFVRRAENEGDPWSGHMALPGGHADPEDPDLAATALRELAEETDLVLPRSDLLGRLDEVHPRSRRLPSVAITPFIAWCEGDAEIRENVEITDHFWIPVPALADPALRSVLSFRRGSSYRAFPSIEYEGHTIWGLTLLVVKRFLALLPPELVEGDGDRASGSAGEPGGG